jgi:hypothetical protein
MVEAANAWEQRLKVDTAQNVADGRGALGDKASLGATGG